jgi:hypothetical protein
LRKKEKVLFCFKQVRSLALFVVVDGFPNTFIYFVILFAIPIQYQPSSIVLQYNMTSIVHISCRIYKAQVKDPVPGDLRELLKADFEMIEETMDEIEL